MIIGQSNVRLRYEFLSTPSKWFSDHLPGDTAQVCESDNVKKEESTRNGPSFAQCFLHGIFAFLHILDARTSAIVVVIELMERAKVSAEVERPGISILLQTV